MRNTKCTGTILCWVAGMLFLFLLSALGMTGGLRHRMMDSGQSRIKRQEPTKFYNISFDVTNGTEESIIFPEEGFKQLISYACGLDTIDGITFSLNTTHQAKIMLQTCSAPIMYSYESPWVNWNSCRIIDTSSLSTIGMCKDVYNGADTACVRNISIVSLGPNRTLEITKLDDGTQVKYCGSDSNAITIINDGGAVTDPPQSTHGVSTPNIVSTLATTKAPGSQPTQGSTPAPTTPIQNTTPTTPIQRTTAKTPIQSTRESPKNETLSQTDESDNTSTIVGVVVCIVAVLAVAAVVVAILIWRRKKQTASASNAKDERTSHRTPRPTRQLNNGYMPDTTYMDVDDSNYHTVEGTHSRPFGLRIQNPNDATYSEIAHANAPGNSEYETAVVASPTGTSNDSNPTADAVYTQVVKPARQNEYAKLHQENRGMTNTYDTLQDSTDTAESQSKPPVPMKNVYSRLHDAAQITDNTYDSLLDPKDKPKPSGRPHIPVKPKLRYSSDYEMVDSVPKNASGNAMEANATNDGVDESTNDLQTNASNGQTVNEQEGVVNPGFDEDDGLPEYATVNKSPKNRN